MKWLRELSIRNKFSIIISLILLILLFGMANFWFGLKIMSAIRAYVGGEGLWSKAQKEAINNLIKYTRTFDEADYKNFSNFLQVPLGDKQARLEMNKADPNLEIVRDGFIKGGNSPEDVEDLIFLYRRFRNNGYMATAVDDWTKGDAEIEKLIGIGENIHIIGITMGNSQALASNATESARFASLIEEVYVLDKRLTLLENHFSATLGEGARRIRDNLIIITIAITILLGSVALGIALYIGRITVRVDKMKSEFVSLVSHELRTPLTAIVGLTSMILKGEYTFNYEKLVQPLQDIKGSSLHLLDLVNHLLEISRIQSGKIKLDLQEVNLSTAIDKNIQIMESLSQQKGISIVFDHHEEIFVLADLEKLEQILYNLLGNAIKFTTKGTIDITVSQKGDKVCVAIKDTGVGIPKKYHARLFGKFEQSDSNNPSASVGLGLGLYLSRALARRMGGDIWLQESEPERGSTFVFCLLKVGTDSAEKLKKKHDKEFVK